MKKFLTRHSEKIIGVLSGLDRVLFRDTLRQLAHVSWLLSFLSYKPVVLKDFPRQAEAITKKIRARPEQMAEASGRPIRYLSFSQVRKEDVALALLQQHPVDSGRAD